MSTPPAEFQMDDHGHFRIRVGDKWSQPTVYQSIAVLDTDDGEKYIGVSAYFEGSIPHETVMLLTGVPGVKSTEYKGNLYEGVGKHQAKEKKLAKRINTPKREMWFLCLATDGEVRVDEMVPEKGSKWLPFGAKPPLNQTEAITIQNMVCQHPPMGGGRFYFISDPKTQGDLMEKFTKAVENAARDLRNGV